MTETQADQLIELMQYLPAIWLGVKQLVFWTITIAGFGLGWIVANALIDQSNRGIINY
ncbi:MAG: hypothetical protein ACF8OB_12960 [Phycisphaeraceae bacterium JB051]